MGTSTIRVGIIVALAVVGAIIVAQFPSSSTQRASGTTGTPAASPSATATRTGSGHNGGGGQGGGQTGGEQGGQQTQAPAKIAVAVYNGTYETGLAHDVAVQLQKKGYKVNLDSWVLDAPDKPVDTTGVYFATARDEDAAIDVAGSPVFRKLGVKASALPENLTVPNDHVQVAVYLGIDYVNA